MNAPKEVKWPCKDAEKCPHRPAVGGKCNKPHPDDPKYQKPCWADVNCTNRPAAGGTCWYQHPDDPPKIQPEQPKKPQRPRLPSNPPEEEKKGESL